MVRKILGLLALAAGWAVLVADSQPCPGYDTREYFDVQYEFQTNCMGEAASGLLHIYDSKESKRRFCHWSGEDGTAPADEAALSQLRSQALNVQEISIVYIRPNDKLIPIGFDFKIRGEPLDTPDNPDEPAPLFRCKDSRADETLAVDKDYVCEKIGNHTETCELKLTYQPHE